MFEILSVILLALLGLGLGIFLAYSSQKFKVEKDPKIEKLEEALPGSNCGACGYPGCSGLAEALAKGEAAYDACKAGGSTTADKVCAVLGKDIQNEKSEKQFAYIRCKGMGKDVAKEKFTYIGIDSCLMAMQTGGGWKECSYGCLELGDCVKACIFDALKINKQGYPEVNVAKCTACGLCVKACPKNLITMIGLKDKTYLVGCQSKDKGSVVRNVCKIGCIGCGLCVKACKYHAIKLENALAEIDQTKCKFCGECVKVCPQKTIDCLDAPLCVDTASKKSDACAACGVCK
ncbi:MAG: RnfABCDGE type electron transport complex subunit B [Candidatus Margulisbacteria bacterium]|nr:RnfABCDGE type electron transport complex subunit B [Candidatus Margulisiibacteriota bacterium]